MNGPHVRRGMLLFGMWWIKTGLEGSGAVVASRRHISGRGTRVIGAAGLAAAGERGLEGANGRAESMDGWMVNKVILDRPTSWMEPAVFLGGQMGWDSVGKR